ncbi:MAG TPA: hypothetical protein VFZ61_06665, partial [Polyangiales bacterium]
NDPFYIHSLSFPDPGAFGGESGVYRSPTPLPSRWLAVSCDEGARDLTRGSFDFDLCAVWPETGASLRLGGEAGRAEIEAVAVYARPNRGVFRSRLDEPNGATTLEDGDAAEVHFLDVPLLATLLFDNRRVGRPIDERVGGVDVLESLPPDVNAKRFSDLPGGKVQEDAYGPLFVDYAERGHFGLEPDGSARVRLPGGHPLVLRVTDEGGKTLAFADGGPFSGEMVQREEMQFYPGERISQGFRRPLFNGLCGGCHGSITGAELDIAINIDVLTHASSTDSHSQPAKSLR